MNLKHWPLYALRITTPRLVLRLPELAELDALAELSCAGVHDPARMPFNTPWTDAPPAQRARGVMRFHWRQLADWSPDGWNLPLAVFRDGEVVGSQFIGAKDFPILREVETGSWLGLGHQGDGIGTEMRAAVLHLAFAGLGAETAVTAALTDNPASLGVTRKLGYQENGLARTRVRDDLGYERRFVLDRDGWQRHRRHAIKVEGLAECLPMFGAAP
ncbi:MAG TPA: GNAT family N-acetyltransferase [Actinomadura sp.]|nr:GNAT family N-acetyltransferase [Actinomadura sp.]